MKTAIIGGGASGIAAAIHIKRINPGAEVTVFERNDRILRKLPATGNGRCNLSNADISPKCYVSKSPACVEKVLSLYPLSEEKRFFESLGILFCEEQGRIYPMSFRATAVSDALRLCAESLGVNVLLNTRIKTLQRKNYAYFCDGKRFDRVIIASGGAAAPSFGTDGSSFKLLKELGHTIVPPSCALVPIYTKENTKPLKGVRARAAVFVIRGTHTISTERGEIQFTDYGLSGIAIMQLSAALKKGDILMLDFCFDYDAPALSDLLKKRRTALSYLSCVDFLTGIVHKSIAAEILSRLKIKPARSVTSLSENELSDICALLKGLKFTFEKNLGFESAQVTRGGALLDEFFPETLESRLLPGLYCIGEALDAAGKCGGYNLHWAWATAAICAAGAASE